MEGAFRLGLRGKSAGGKSELGDIAGGGGWDMGCEGGGMGEPRANDILRSSRTMPEVEVMLDICGGKKVFDEVYSAVVIELGKAWWGLDVFEERAGRDSTSDMKKVELGVKEPKELREGVFGTCDGRGAKRRVEGC